MASQNNAHTFNPFGCDIQDALGIPKECRLGITKIVIVAELDNLTQVYLKGHVVDPQFTKQVSDDIKLNFVKDVEVSDDCSVVVTDHTK